MNDLPAIHIDFAVSSLPYATIMAASSPPLDYSSDCETGELTEQGADTERDIITFIERLAAVDRALKEALDYNLLSGEGRVLLSAIQHNRSMLKVIANNGTFSYRTAYNGLKKLENHGILRKTSENEDLRRVIIDLDVQKLLKFAIESID